jgi:hypothetical protein
VRYATELHALGERVIAAAPALRPVARLVRESVELGPDASIAARIVAMAVAGHENIEPEQPIVT